MRRWPVGALVLGLLAHALAPPADAADAAKPDALRVRGRLTEAFAYRLHDPGDVSKLKTLGWLEGKYTFSDAANVRITTRGAYDAVFEATDRYPANVERDQKTELSLREAIVTLSREDLDVRLGRQQIVWGEAIGTFVTDVVNPRDFREFVLPDFTELRIPLWALDFTWRLGPGVNLEGVWTPDTMHNRLPKRGAEFQFAGANVRFRNPVVRLPDNPDQFSLDRSEGGARLAVLRAGWDVGLIYYDGADKTPVLFQRRVPRPPGPDVIVLDPQHPRLHIVGATLTKSVASIVARGEVALTVGKRYETADPLDRDGVVRRDTIDYLIGVDYTFFSAVDVSVQLTQKILTGSAANLTRPGVAGQVTTSVALRLTTGFFDDALIATLLLIVDAERGDVRVSPRLEYLATRSITVAVGGDFFEGPQRTLYGQFDRNDRLTFTTTWRF